MNDGKPAAAIVKLVDRVVACLALAVVEMARAGALAHQLGDHLLEEAQHAMLGDVDRLDHPGRFDDRDARAVELEQRDL